MSSNPIHAANPANNAIVKASAGVGKTYLLVTRLLRLLLEDVEPDSILAITFTRKAATEMQTRLYERLYELAICERSQAVELLSSIGLEPDDKLINKAQSLYEYILQNPKQVRSTTFHSFCQDILQKFPLEAEVPPGFDLLDDPETYRQIAWEILYDEATRNPDDETALALESLFDLTGSIHSTKDCLNSFLEQRADWWAYTSNSDLPIATGMGLLQEKLHFNESENIYALVFNELRKKQLTRLIELWDLHGTATIKKHIAKLQPTLETEVFENQSSNEKTYESHFNTLWSVFYNTKNEIRETKPSKARAKKMGENGEDEFLQIFSNIANVLSEIKQKRNIKYNIEINKSWYVAGNRLVEIYQQIKAEQRLLDFTDLEWNTYKLLNHSDNALWVQYKLDQRIKHLLIDEFQDTNPTQWRLLLPIMQEFQYNTDEHKSVFIVGDIKQSIYSFRRADPLLLNQAGLWLHDSLGGTEFPMDMSRRSSPQIMHLVNAVFQSEDYKRILPSFTEHSTYLNEVPGWIRLLPLIESTAQDAEDIVFRNPLKQPKPQKEDPFLEEGRLIANTISQLIQDKTTLCHGSETREIMPGDIMLLIRSRTHVKQYEKALRESNIPYTSNNKGTLFDCQEIQDMISLLKVLYSPYNDLPLAITLRSPIFNCSNDDLLFFYQKEKQYAWYEILTESTQALPENLQNAKEKLSHWRAYALTLPIHDMLDKIYFEANVLKRYAETFPKHLVSRAQNNLLQFLSLALQIDSGRYPSIGRFLARLESLRQSDASPDEATSTDTSAVRIMTIHGSKGLEAPVVFLADTCDARSNKSKHYQAVVNWPQDKETPESFRLCPTKKYYDNSLEKLLDYLAQKEKTEDANLLYVALTRARQALYISGTSNKGKAQGWYKTIQENWPEELQGEVNIGTAYESTLQGSTPELVFLPELFSSTEEFCDVAPENAENEDNQTRGIIIHRALELLTQDNIEPAACLQQLINEYSNFEPSILNPYFEEAKSLLNNQVFSQYFDKDKYIEAMNEMPVQIEQNAASRLGIIDRVVISNENCFVIDYKTHSDCEQSQLSDIAQSYKSQMFFYKKLVQNIWPEKTAKCIILFTHFQKEFEIL